MKKFIVLVQLGGANWPFFINAESADQAQSFVMSKADSRLNASYHSPIAHLATFEAGCEWLMAGNFTDLGTVTKGQQ